MTSGVPVQAIDLGVVSHQGRVRLRNEDAFSHDRLSDTQGHLIGWIFVVADGVGGEKHGDIASQMAVQRVIDIYKGLSLQNPIMSLADVLRETIHFVNTEIYNRSIELNAAGHMGTTLVVAVLRADGVLHVGWVGDSRLYVISRRMEKIRQVSQDHTEASELLRQKLISQDQALTHPRRNVLSRSVGGQPETTPEFAEGTLELNDTIVICSDGLTRHVTPDHIKTLALQPVSSEQIAQQMVAAANQMGGKDNITALVVHVGPRESQMDTDIPPPLFAEPELAPMDSTASRPFIEIVPDDSPPPPIKQKPRPRRPMLLWGGLAVIVLLAVLGAGLILLSQQPQTPTSTPITDTDVLSTQSAILLTLEATLEPTLTATIPSPTQTRDVPSVTITPTLTSSPVTPTNTALPATQTRVASVTIQPLLVISPTPDDSAIFIATDLMATPDGTPTTTVLFAPLSEPYPNGTCLMTRQNAPVYAAVGSSPAYTLPQNIVVFIVREGQGSYSVPTLGQTTTYYSVKPNDGRAGVGWINSLDLIPVQELSPEQQAAVFSPVVVNDDPQIPSAAWTLNQSVLVRANLLGCVPMRLKPDVPERLYIVENTAQVTIANSAPVSVNGNLWWNIRLADGREGWIQQTYLTRTP